MGRANIQNQQEFVTFVKNFGGYKVDELRPVAAPPSAQPAAVAAQAEPIHRFSRGPEEPEP